MKNTNFTPFFSVVIPLYNKESQINRTLKSVLNQTFTDFEITLINDGSTDRSAEVVESFKDERINLFHQENQGASEARNQGILKAKSDFIALLDADDHWLPNHLEELHKSISLFPEASFYCNAYHLTLKPDFTQKASYSLENTDKIQIVEDYFKASLIHPIAHTSAVAFNKEDFWEIGGFRKHIISGQDIDLWIRFGLYKTVVFNPTYTSIYDRTVPNSLTKKHLRRVKHEFLNNYNMEIENAPKGFKQFLDLNRYAIAIQCKYYNDKEVFSLLKEEISPKSLNWKQRLLLNTPSFLVIQLKKLHSFLISKGLYFTAFR